MNQNDTQVKLPFSRAVQIAVQGIRIRFGRSLVTVSGVVLGIAFLMSNLTSQLITRAVANEREVRQTVSLMLSMVKSEIGALSGKRLAVVVCGTMNEAERQLVDKILEGEPAEVRASGLASAKVRAVDVAKVGEGAGLLLVLGDGGDAPASIEALTAGMTQRIMLDSQAARRYAAGEAAGVRRELFFGKQVEEQVARMAKQAKKERIRTIWIVTISLLVTVIGVSNALLMSVTERFREIGTMKCLGALSSFIRTVFLIESSLIGFAGSILGVIAGTILPLVAYGFTYRFALVLGAMPYGWLSVMALGAVAAGTCLSVVAAIYPANFASRMVPASALRSTV
jgi:hypothetical protein